MAVVTIIGSGMMGSALAFPARENGHEVRLVGTHLDRDIIDNCKKTGRHPKFTTTAFALSLHKKLKLYVKITFHWRTRGLALYRPRIQTNRPADPAERQNSRTGELDGRSAGLGGIRAQ